jgi:hypothetical protein
VLGDLPQGGRWRRGWRRGDLRRELIVAGAQLL